VDALWLAFLPLARHQHLIATPGEAYDGAPAPCLRGSETSDVEQGVLLTCPYQTHIMPQQNTVSAAMSAQ